jgi:biotin operon repressor
MNKEEMLKRIEELEKENEMLKVKAAKGRSFGKKYMVLEVLSEGPKSILEIGEALDVSSKNVSSQLCYLKKEGFGIITDEGGRKVVTKYKGEDVSFEEVKGMVEEKRKLFGESKS